MTIAPSARPHGHVPRPAVARLPPLLRPRQRRAGRHGHSHQVGDIYTISTQYLHNIYIISTQYLQQQQLALGDGQLHPGLTAGAQPPLDRGLLHTQPQVNRCLDNYLEVPSDARRTMRTCVSVQILQKLFNSIGTLDRYFYLLQLH